jgi:hypothetical protein
MFAGAAALDIYSRSFVEFEYVSFMDPGYCESKLTEGEGW